MALTVTNRRRNAVIALCVGFLAGAGTIECFGEHAPGPSVGAILRQIDAGQTYPVPVQLAQNGDQGFDLLKRMIEADAQTSIEGDQTTTIYRDGRPIVSEQHVLRDGARGLRIVYNAPPRMQGTVVVDDGNCLWRYDSRRNTLEVSPSKIKKRMEQYPSILRAHHNRQLVVSVMGAGAVAGRPCTIIQVQRLRDPGPIRTFWVDDATGVQLKMQMNERSGAPRSVTEFTSIAFNVAIPAGSFAKPATPPSANVVEQTPPPVASSIPSAQVLAGFPLLQPGYLPPGYRFASAQVSTFQHRQMVHARYVGGLDPLSIFQTPATGRDTAVSFPNQGVATMVISGHTLVVVGNLPKDELRRVITSMHP